MGGKFPKEKSGLSDRLFGTNSMHLQDFFKKISGGKATEYGIIDRKAKKIRVEQTEEFLATLFPKG
jgi:hypothetical protein